jgi:hypothetical protein
MELPVYEMRINPDEASDVEVSFVALVDKPAIERNFMMFNSHALNFTINNDKRIISGPAMVADVPIYRKDASGEYNVFFSAATIKEIVLKFAKKGYAKNLNLFHDRSMPAEGVTIFYSFVSDKSMGIPAMAGYEDLPDGSWFISAKVESDEIWARIKAGEFKGFSVEGNFSFVKNGKSEENLHLIERDFMADLKTLLSDVKTLLFNTPVPAPPAPVVPVVAEAITAKLKDGTEVSVSELVMGGVVTIGAAPAAAGDYELEDGTKMTVGEGGVISAITPAEQIAAPEPVDYTKEFAAIKEQFTAYTSATDQKFTAYETKFQEQAAAIQKAQAMNEKLFAIVEKLAETPTADPVGQNTNNFQAQKAEARAERLQGLQSSLNKLKS